MEIEEYGGVLREILEAVEENGVVRRIVVTPEEMREIQFGTAWRTVVSKYYGDAMPVMDQIITDRDGKFVSFYYENVLVALEYPDVPNPASDVVFQELEVEEKGTTTFYNESPTGRKTLLVGTGNTADDFVFGYNENIELGIAARIQRSNAYQGDGAGNFNIQLADNQDWSFVITVGSLHESITNITEMYDVELFLGHGNGDGQHWKLKFVDGKFNGQQVKNYMWYEGPTPVITDSATDVEFRVTQMIQRYSFVFIKSFLPETTEYNEVGAPLGTFELKLTATPKIKGNDPVEVVTQVTVSKKD